jgi:hypothetical protein
MKSRNICGLCRLEKEARGVFDWIIEADVYRLRKAAGEASDPRERREIEALAEHKLQVLRRRAGAIETSANA